MKKTCSKIIPLIILLFYGTLCFSSEQKEFARLALLRVALEQAEKISPDWHPDQRDCSGFVRYVYRKAVTGTSLMWNDGKGNLTSFLTANELVAYNFKRLSNTIKKNEIRTGDLLVYYFPEKEFSQSWHVMIILEPPDMVRQEPLVIYHNGKKPPEGAVRKLWLEDLYATDTPVWNPTPGNKNFMGVYRWNGWSKSIKNGGNLEEIQKTKSN